ncbi:hypothetical protein HOP50_03g20920 [Chloropicon primus]|nr:hypothetical protein A3770_03p20920 [Chloropicon primus]UPQ98786.1 hypothetical protein HOP50_03g20920 [Chloropicon primus]|eukprot:QDZ19574.1 hypothetical protein A3770_03p20920 [Chloropicon primus]
MRKTLIALLLFAGTCTAERLSSFPARGRDLLQADAARDDLTSYARQCIPQCKRGHWYTLGIPVISCVHEEELEWLNGHVCKTDVKLSQLMALLPKPHECSLKGLKHWLEETCNFPFPSAKLDPNCRPRCKQGRWYSLGIPIPDCNQMEYDIWLHDFICSVDDPVSVQTLMETADNPDSCNLNDLSFYLKETCKDVNNWSPSPTNLGLKDGSLGNFAANAGSPSVNQFSGQQGPGHGDSHYLQEQYDPSYQGVGDPMPPPSGQVLQLSMESCGSVQAADGTISSVPVVLKIDGAQPNSQIAIFRSKISKQDDPLSSVAVPDNLKCARAGLGLGGTFQEGPNQVKAWAVGTQENGDALFKIDDAAAMSRNVCSAYVYQAVDMSTCKLSNVLDTRGSNSNNRATTNWPGQG